MSRTRRSSKEGRRCNQPIVKLRETFPAVSPTEWHDLLNLSGFSNSSLHGADIEACMEAPMEDMYRTNTGLESYQVRHFHDDHFLY